jgi:hypothetical protein
MYACRRMNCRYLKEKTLKLSEHRVMCKYIVYACSVVFVCSFFYFFFKKKETLYIYISTIQLTTFSTFIHFQNGFFL